MKGTVQYVSKDETLVKSWVVWYNEQPDGGNITFVDSLPLHPDDVNEISAWQQIFDTIEARIAANQEVEFEIKYYWDGIMEQPIEVAKLIKPEYPELEGTMNLCEDILKKKTGKMTEEEWQAAERSQTSKTKQIMTSIEWLRNELVNNENIRWRGTNINVLIEQAQAMHKQEIIDAVGVGSQFDRDYLYGYHDKAEQYYQETFVSKGSDNSPKEENKISFGEISDEEIEKAANEPNNDGYSFIEGAKWYREQLKRNNEKE